MRVQEKLHITYQDGDSNCTSVKKYRLKFCTNCAKKKCCYPYRTQTRSLEFFCQSRYKFRKFMWIKRCKCSRKCYKVSDRNWKLYLLTHYEKDVTKLTSERKKYRIENINDRHIFISIYKIKALFVVNVKKKTGCMFSVLYYIGKCETTIFVVLLCNSKKCWWTGRCKLID